MHRILIEVHGLYYILASIKYRRLAVTQGWPIHAPRFDSNTVLYDTVPNACMFRMCGVLLLIKNNEMISCTSGRYHPRIDYGLARHSSTSATAAAY